MNWPVLPGVAAAVLTTVYVILLLMVESQIEVIGLLAVGGAAVLIASFTGMLRQVGGTLNSREDLLHLLVLLGTLAVIGFFREDHFTLLLIATIMLYVLATIGLNLQFGFAGVLNFAGASFFGVGGYTAAVLGAHTPVPGLAIVLMGGVMAALIGSILLLPVLRTRGHYAAVVTIAFASGTFLGRVGPRCPAAR